MDVRLPAEQGAKSKREKGRLSHYKRVHDESAGAGDAQQGGALCPAAEDDGLGWQLGAVCFDPMYTIARRNREVNAANKDAFFKKLKLRTESAPAADGDEQDSDSQDNNSDKQDAEKQEGEAAPAAGAMRFGFGMMGGALAPEPSKDKKKKKKKHKDKTKRSKPA